MADDRVVLEVDMQERGMARDPLSAAAENVARTASVSAELQRQNRARQAYVNANRQLFGQRPATSAVPPGPLPVASAAEAYAQLGISRSFQRRNAIFPGAPSLVEPVRSGMLSGGQGGGGGRRPPRRPRDRFNDPLQLGQIFTGGPVTSALGLRAAGLATVGAIGAGFLALDAGIRKLIQSVELLNRLWQDQVKILQPYSAALTSAQAERNIAIELNRFRLAQQSGPQLARTFRAETRWRISVENSLNELATTLAPMAETLFLIGANILEVGNEIGAIRTVLRSMAVQAGPIGVVARMLLERLGDEGEADDAFFEDQLRFFTSPFGTFRGRAGRPESEFGL